MLSEPQGEPDEAIHLAIGPSPRLANGAARLRPLLYRSATAFDILWGPIFFVGE